MICTTIFPIFVWRSAPPQSRVREVARIILLCQRCRRRVDWCDRFGCSPGSPTSTRGGTH